MTIQNFINRTVDLGYAYIEKIPNISEPSFRLITVLVLLVAELLSYGQNKFHLYDSHFLDFSLGSLVALLVFASTQRWFTISVVYLVIEIVSSTLTLNVSSASFETIIIAFALGKFAVCAIVAMFARNLTGMVETEYNVKKIPLGQLIITSVVSITTLIIGTLLLRYGMFYYLSEFDVAHYYTLRKDPFIDVPLYELIGKHIGSVLISVLPINLWINSILIGKQVYRRETEYEYVSLLDLCAYIFFALLILCYTMVTQAFPEVNLYQNFLTIFGVVPVVMSIWSLQRKHRAIEIYFMVFSYFVFSTWYLSKYSDVSTDIIAGYVVFYFISAQLLFYTISTKIVQNYIFQQRFVDQVSLANQFFSSDDLPIVCCDGNGNILSISSFYDKFLKQPRENYHGKSINILQGDIKSIEIGSVVSEIADNIRGIFSGEITETEFPVRCFSTVEGELCYLKTSVRRAYNPGFEKDVIVFLSKDVTDEIVASEKMSLFITSAPSAVVVFNEKFEHVYTSDEALKMVSREPANDLTQFDKNEFSLIHRDDVEFVSELRSEILALEFGDTLVDARPIRLYNGEEYRWISRNHRKVRDKTGEIYIIMGVRDIHEEYLNRLSIEELYKEQIRLFKDQPSIISMWDTEFNLISCTEKFAKLFSLEIEFLIGKNISEIMVGDLWPHKDNLLEAFDEMAYSDQLKISLFSQIIPETGTTRNYQIACNWTNAFQRHDTVLICAFEDVTEQSKIHQTLTDEINKNKQYMNMLNSTAQPRLVFENTTDQAVIFVNQSYIDVNKSILRYHRADDIIGQKRSEIFIPTLWDKYFSDTGLSSIEFLSRLPYHKKQTYFLKSEPHLDGLFYNLDIEKAFSEEGIDIIDTVMVDVGQIYKKTEDLELANKKLEQLVSVDPLTGALSRSGFFKWISKLPVGDHEYIVTLDIDYFKSVNDQYGHDVGDLVLKEFAELMIIHMGKHGKVARFGGEEFILYYTDLGEYQVLEHVEELRRLLENHTIYTQTGVKIVRTSSLGVAAVTFDKSGMRKTEEVLLTSDRAAQEAKNTGRNRVIFASKEIVDEWIAEGMMLTTSDIQKEHSARCLFL